MRDRNRTHDTNISQERRHSLSSRTTRRETKKSPEDRHTLKNLQQSNELSSASLHGQVRISVVNLKAEEMKSQKLTRLSRRKSSLTSTMDSSEETKPRSSFVSPRAREALSNDLSGDLNTKGRPQYFRKNGQTLVDSEVSSGENRIAPVTRRSLSVSEAGNTTVFDTRSSRKRTSDVKNYATPSKRLSRSIENRTNEGKENVGTTKCSDCGKMISRLRVSHHMGTYFCNMCETVRQTQSGFVQISHKRCSVLLFDIKKQLGGVNQTVSYIVSGNNLKPLLGQQGTSVPVRKRFRCEIQTGSDGKFRQGGEPTKYRVPKLRIKRIQSVEEVNVVKHASLKHRILPRRSSSKFKEDKTAVSTRSGRIRRPTYKMRLNESISNNTDSLNRNMSTVLNDTTLNSTKVNVPSGRDRRFRSSVMNKRPSIQNISSKRLLHKYSNQNMERKPLPISLRSRVSNVKSKNPSSVSGKLRVSKTKTKVNSGKSLKVHRDKKVTKIPYCCKMCQKNFSSTVEGKSHELSHDNKILKIIVDKYSPDILSTDKVETQYNVNTGKCLQNLVWIPADIIKGEMPSVSERERNSDSIYMSDDKNELPSDPTCDNVTESLKNSSDNAVVGKVLECIEQTQPELPSSEIIRNTEIEDSKQLNIQSTDPMMEIEKPNGKDSNKGDANKPTEDTTVLCDNVDKSTENLLVTPDDIDKPIEDVAVIPEDVNEPTEGTTIVPDEDKPTENPTVVCDIEKPTEGTTDIPEVDKPTENTIFVSDDVDKPTKDTAVYPDEDKTSKDTTVDLDGEEKTSNDITVVANEKEPTEDATILPDVDNPSEDVTIASEDEDKPTKDKAVIPDVDEPTVNTAVIPAKSEDDTLRADLDSKPNNSDHNQEDEISDNFEEPIIDVGTEEVSNVVGKYNDLSDELQRETVTETLLTAVPEAKVTGSENICRTSVDERCDGIAFKTEKLLNAGGKSIDVESQILSEKNPDVLSENEFHKAIKKDTKMEPCAISEQESVEEKHLEEQRDSKSKVDDNKHIAGIVVESLMEQIFEGTCQDEKGSEEGQKDYSLNTIIETLSEEQNSSNDNKDERNENSNDVTTTVNITDVQKSRDSQIDSYLEPISDDETECFDSFDV